jgi:hypothetical protein
MLLLVVVCWLLVSLMVVALCVMAGRAEAEPVDEVLPMAYTPTVGRFARR